MSAEIMLDPKIRNWVLLPITFIIFVVGLLRHYLMVYFKTEPATDPKSLKDSQVLRRSAQLRNNGKYLRPEAFKARKNYFNNRETGVFFKEVAKNINTPMSDPTQMMDMMKGNLTTIVPQIGMMTWISYFFAGFVLVKTPFPLTMRFKTMLQRGVELSTLDVSYVSSLSWYFLNTFGLRGLHSLVLGDKNEATEDTEKMVTMGMGPGMGGQPVMDPAQANKAEREELELFQHTWALDRAEEKLLRKQ